MSNALLERIHQVHGNIVRTGNIFQTYGNKNYPWTRILDEAAFAFFLTTNMQKGYNLGHLVFFHDMILPMKHEVDFRLIHPQKQTQTNKDNIRKIRHRVDHDYKVGDDVMFTTHTEYKYETPCMGPFMIMQFLPIAR